MDRSLHELLEALRREIDRAELGRDDLDHLAELAAELELRIEGETDVHQSLLDRLRGSVDRFEAEHPLLSESLGRAADSLSAMGL